MRSTTLCEKRSTSSARRTPPVPERHADVMSSVASLVARAPAFCAAPRSARRASASSRRAFVPAASAEDPPGEVPDAAPSASSPAPSAAPVVVFGANGKTGKRCVAYAAKTGRPVVACTRAGAFSAADAGVSSADASLVTSKPGDVSKATPAELAALLQGAGSCIFAASASPSGGSPQDVDKAGLVAVARACVAARVPRLVVVSSGSVTKPLSPVYVFLNFFGGIMRAKIEGEDALRALYFDRDECDYVIVRPGGLTEDEPRGVSAVELNQGDDKSGRISRADVAAICVEAAAAAGTPLASNATFECYWADTAKSLEAVGLSNMMGGTNQDADYVSGRERRGDSWMKIFEGLRPDEPGVAQQGWGPSL